MFCLSKVTDDLEHLQRLAKNDDIVSLVGRGKRGLSGIKLWMMTTLLNNDLK